MLLPAPNGEPIRFGGEAICFSGVRAAGRGAPVGIGGELTAAISIDAGEVGEVGSTDCSVRLGVLGTTLHAQAFETLAAADALAFSAIRGSAAPGV